MNTKPKSLTKEKMLRLTQGQYEFLNQVIAPKYHGGSSEYLRQLIDKDMTSFAQTN